MSHLIQILLPVCDDAGRPFDSADYERVASDLTSRFGGVTAFTRSPAEGRWRTGGETERDDIVVVEVIDPDFDRTFWKGYRAELESRFRQDVILIRAQETEII